MKLYKMLIFATIISAFVVQALDLKDVQFKTINGEMHSFKELADQGKHVYFILSFDG